MEGDMKPILHLVADTGALVPVGSGERYSPLDLVESFLRRFIVYPSEHAVVAHTLWIAHCHLLECFDVTPRLAFMSAEKASGKTRALEVTALFVPSPQLSFSASAASLVRIIGRGHEEGVIPTILFDEIDNVFGTKNQQEGAADLRAALNSGYRRGAFAIRCTNHGASVEHYPCFAPLAVAGLKELPDTLGSRAIQIRMRRRAPDEEVESFRLRYHPDQARPIRDALTEWCGEAQAEIAGYDPEMPAGITDRNADCWEPPLAIADAAGSDWPKRARDAAIYLTGAAAEAIVTVGVELLDHIREAFDGADRLWTSELIKRLCDREESPWKDIRGKPIDDRVLASRIKGYGVKSTDIRIGSERHKGYYASSFHDAWKRYLPTVGDKGDKGDNFDNENNFVADVADVAAGKPETVTRVCSACDGNHGRGCPTCKPKEWGVGV
jgi:hypothetical protein